MEAWTLSVNCPRLTDLREAVVNVCRDRGYECDVSADKGWLMQTLTFKIKGNDLRAFKWSLKDTINDYSNMRIVCDE